LDDRVRTYRFAKGTKRTDVLDHDAMEAIESNILGALVGIDKIALGPLPLRRLDHHQILDQRL
jgi:hypothetical protein